VHEIRLATPDDVHEIAQFQTDVWNETYRGLVSDDYLAGTTVDVREARWGSRIRAGERSVFLAREAGRLDGVASAGARRDGGAEPTLELMSLYVRVEARGSGLGSRLLQEAIKREPAVLYVFEGNSGAIRFYRRHTFELDGYTELDADTGLTTARMVRASEFKGSDGR